MPKLSISKGIDGIPTETIPSDPQGFVDWFRGVGIKRWFANGDVRNAVPGAGISISGDISTPATIGVGDDVSALFNQPYVLLGAPAAPAALTDYRSLQAESTVLALTDAGPKLPLIVGVATNGIDNTKLRQGAATSVVGNATGLLANVADIAAAADNTTLVRAAGLLTFSALPVAAIASISSNTAIGNVTGGAAAPTELSKTQLTTLVNPFTAALSGAVPAPITPVGNVLSDGGTWIAPGSSPLTTKGDLYGHSTVDARIPVGSDGTSLLADSTQVLGVKWATPPSGTGGGVNNTAPGTLNDLVFWWQSDTARNVTVGAALPQMVNSCPWLLPYSASNNFTGNNGGATLSATQQNSLNVYTFGGSNANYYMFPGAGPILNQSTVFVVFKPSQLTQNAVFIQGSATNSYGFFVNTSGKLAIQSVGVGAVGTDTTTLAIGTWFQANVTYNSTSGAWAFRVARANGASGSVSHAISAGALGVGSDPATASFYRGDLAEIIVYSRVLSGTEITTIETYLHNKWNV